MATTPEPMTGTQRACIRVLLAFFAIYTCTILVDAVTDGGWLNWLAFGLDVPTLAGALLILWPLLRKPTGTAWLKGPVPAGGDRITAALDAWTAERDKLAAETLPDGTPRFDRVTVVQPEEPSA